MKKTIITLAAFAACSLPVWAQSSVTLYGVVDTAVTAIRGNGTGSRTLLDSNGLDQPRLGFRGREDLGGGLAADFVLEAVLYPDTGVGGATNTNNQASGAAPAGAAGGQGLTFGRRATVSLLGAWGEFRMGRDYAPSFSNTARFDPFVASGIGQGLNLLLAGTGPVGVRVSNALYYFLPPAAGGFYGSAAYAMGENASNATNAAGASIADDGRYVGTRVGWGRGPFDVSVSVAKAEYAAGDVRIANAGAWYDFGVVKPMVLVNQTKVSSATPNTYKTWLIGAQIPLGVGQFRISYAQQKQSLLGGTASQAAVGYVHNLSKRTAVYGTYARLKNAPGTTFGMAVQNNGVPTTAGASLSGLQAGIRHIF